MEQRSYGSKPDQLSVVGFGGICVMDETPDDAARIVSAAIDRGVNYFDVAPQYGNAQDRLGPALAPYREQVFLACKTLERNADAATRQLQDSLKLLQTDRFDLYQLHSVTTDEEVDQILAPGGALEAFVQARDDGLVRYLGFSAHSEEAALRLMEAFSFDSILFPLNWVTWYGGGFGPRVMERAKADGTAILALKALARRAVADEEARQWKKAWYQPAETYPEAELALRFTLSLPVTAAVSPGHEELLMWACDAADRYTPPSQAEHDELRERAQSLDPIFAATG